MLFDYDLVVIGNTPGGVQAAITAIGQQARVALVEQPFYGRVEGAEAFWSWHFWQLSRLSQGPLDWSTLYPLVQAQHQRANSALPLGTLGIDFILGSGKFFNQPFLQFHTPERILRSRSYLLATGSRLASPKIDGFAQVGCLSAFELWQMPSLAGLPSHLTLAGSSPYALQLAQILQGCGKKITLLLDTPSLLPHLDKDVSCLLQAQLEAQGIALSFSSPITQIRWIDGKKWILAHRQALVVEELVLVDAYQGNTDGLNLPGVGVALTETGLLVKETLQTSHPRIWAIGSVINGETSLSRTQYQAEIAVNNALSGRRQDVNYYPLAEYLPLNPPLAWVGLTEREAGQLFGQDFRVLKTPFKVNLKAQALGKTNGFCKLIVSPNGEIYGTQIIGEQAEELIQIMALAIAEKIPLHALTKLSSSAGSLGEIIRTTAQKKVNPRQ